MIKFFFNQEEFDIRLEWGIRGVEELRAISDVIIIVDILSFSTCVSVAAENGALIFPYRWKDETALDFAKSKQAELADFNRKFANGYSLSPTSLLNISANTKLVLPSPNGSSLSLSTGSTPTLCGSLRNAVAVANHAMQIGNKIAVIAAGEKWGDGSLRVAIEDYIGAGAITSHLNGHLSPESELARNSYLSMKNNLVDTINACISGKELITRGFEKDVELACELNVSSSVPILIDGYYKGV